MIAAHTVAQLRDAEQYRLAATADGELMRRAAWAVADAALHLLARPRPGRRVLLLIGPGNNGGDALFAGAFLRRRGIAVTALFVDRDRAHPAGREALRRAGGRTVDLGWAGSPTFAGTIEAKFRIGRALAGADLVIDGLLGIGARPPLRPPMAAMVRAINDSGVPVLAVDVPSGVDPDTGRVDPDTGAIRAAVTVTIGAASTGLLIADETGELVVAELGLAPRDVEPDAITLQDGYIDAAVVGPGPQGDKFSSGVVGICAGSAEYPGAAVLCVGAAVNLRPGMVRYAGPQAAAVVTRWSEVVAADEPDAAGRVQAWVVGPGMGTDGAALRRLLTVFDAQVPVLIDADGLTLLALHPTVLPDRVAAGRGTYVLTPHVGEFARLFPDLDPDARLASARSAAAASGAVVLLKGHRTVVAAPDGRTAVNHTGSGWLATAGSGDVLSGVIGSLLAGGRDPFEAAAIGAHLHGRAGERAERAGEYGAQQLWRRLRTADPH